MSEIDYELREKDIRFFNDMKLTSNPGFKKMLTSHQAIIPGAMSAIAFFYFIYYQDFRTGILIGGVGVIWGLLVPLYLRHNSWQQVRKHYSDEDMTNILGKRTLKAQPGRLVETINGEDTTIPWKDIMRIEINKDKTYGFLYFDHNSALIIPKKTIKKTKFIEFMQEVMEYHTQANE